jgi:hypothetical protein
MLTQFWLESQKERDHSENLGVDGTIILQRILRDAGFRAVDLINLAQDSDRWRALENTIINLLVQ